MMEPISKVSAEEDSSFDLKWSVLMIDMYTRIMIYLVIHNTKLNTFMNTKDNFKGDEVF